MDSKLTRKAFLTLGLVCFSALLLPAAAFPWNQATHAYIAERLGTRVGHGNLHKIWGSVAPDFFNYIFDSAVCPGWVSDQTHGTHAETFLKVRDAASSEKEDALAYGFLSHNQQWGADYIAHISGLRPGYEKDRYNHHQGRTAAGNATGPCPHPTFGEVLDASFGMSPDTGMRFSEIARYDGNTSIF